MQVSWKGHNREFVSFRLGLVFTAPSNFSLSFKVKDSAPAKEASPSIGVMDVDTIVKYINGDLEEEERASRKAEKRRRQKEKKLEEHRKKEEEEERQRLEEERKRKEEEERKRREEERRKREEEQERKRREEEERKRKLEEERKRKEEEERRSKNASKKKNKKGGNKSSTFEEETFANEISQLEKVGRKLSESHKFSQP